MRPWQVIFSGPARLRFRRRAARRNRRLLFEALEDRSLLATLVNTGTAADVIYTLPATTNTAFLEDDGTSGNGTLQLRSSNGTFTTTVFANPMGSLTINRGSASDTITLNGLPDFTAALTIGASTSPFSSMTFAGGMTLGLNKSLVAYASGTIATSGSTAKVTTSGSGAVSLTTARDIQLNTGASITTVNGSITLLANQQTPSTAGDFIGLYIDGAVVQASGTGAVNASGKGGNASNVVQYGVDIVRGSAVTGGSGGLQISGLGGDSPTGTNHGVVVDAGSQISAAGTGSVTIQGTGGSGGDRNYGISLRATGTLVTSSGGNVQVTGQAGAGASTGVEINTSAQVSAGGNGTVTVLGTGGTGASPGNPGVEIVTGSISSGGGNVTVTGHGGGTGTSSNNDGVLISAAQVTAGKTGKVTVTGTGGGGSGSGNPGVVVQGTNTAVTSSGGDVQVTGMGGGTGSSSQNYGIEVAGSAQISAGGSGAVTLQGTAGLGSGTLNYGVSLQGSSPTITSGGGTIQVTGIEGTATTARGLDLNGGTITTAVNGGSITLVANSVSISVLSAVSANSTGSVTIKPFTTGVAVNLGTSTDPISGPLNLTPTEFGRITAGTIDIGDANSGAITVTADITRAASTAMNLTSGGAISFTGGQVNTAGGNLSLSPGSAASVGVAKTGTDVSMSSTGTLSFAAGSDLAIAIDGKTVDTQYQQLNVIGSVDLTGADLALSGSYTPLQGDRFVLVNNDGTDPITGTFTGLPEGQAFAIASGALAGTYQITYRGGDGNDVVLALANPDQVLQGTSGDDVWLVTRNGNNVDVTLNGAGLLSQPYTSLTTLTINGLAGNDTLNVDLSAGNAIPSGGAFFNGGDPTTGPGDKLTITGGSQGTVTYNYVNANDGSIVMSNFGTIDYTGLEPITNSGTASDMVFNLPAGTNAATLGDDGTTGNGISRLGAATFETTNFTNPTNSLTINPGGAADTITVNAVPDLHATLTIGSSASPFSSIGFTGAISLTGSHNLGATAAKSISLSASATLGTAAGSISLSSNQGTMASSGNFIGIDIAGGAVRSISGSISLAGRGGTGGIGIGNQIGVYIHGLGIVGDATTGTVTVTGTGGTTPTGSLGGNAGIELERISKPS
jgi:hypothetical protein